MTKGLVASCAPAAVMPLSVSPVVGLRPRILKCPALFSAGRASSAHNLSSPSSSTTACFQPAWVSAESLSSITTSTPTTITTTDIVIAIGVIFVIASTAPNHDHHYCHRPIVDAFLANDLTSLTSSFCQLPSRSIRTS